MSEPIQERAMCGDCGAPTRHTQEPERCIEHPGGGFTMIGAPIYFCDACGRRRHSRLLELEQAEAARRAALLAAHDPGEADEP